ncbi:MAG: hypothetical protein L6V93_01660 [Clostridiales bacterium]|nr:MAG: hypothetical protein L6V93_01660 [Clostridiales bacterium]
MQIIRIRSIAIFPKRRHREHIPKTSHLFLRESGRRQPQSALHFAMPGFGLQFQIAGEDFDPVTPNEFERTPTSTENTVPDTDSSQNPGNEEPYTAEEYSAELTDEEKLEKAYQTLCPITKYSGKTMAEVLTVDPHALVWVANKYKGNPEISEAAKLICEHALSENNE